MVSFLEEWLISFIRNTYLPGGGMLHKLYDFLVQDSFANGPVEVSEEFYAFPELHCLALVLSYL